MPRSRHLARLMSDRTAVVRRQFDMSADTFSGTRTDSASFQAQRRFALGSLAGPFEHILEIGCGAGHMLDELAPRGSRVVAVDLSHKMLCAAHGRLPKNAKLAQADACLLPFRDAMFDAVLCMGVLEYVSAEDLLAEIARVLRHSGIAVFTVSQAAFKARTLGAGLRCLVQAVFRRRSADAVFARYTIDRLDRTIGAVGFVPRAHAYCGVRVVPWPADELFPRATGWINDTLEKWGPIAWHPWFASVFCLSVHRGQRPAGRRPAAVTPDRTKPQDDNARRPTRVLQTGVTDSPAVAGDQPRIA